MSISKCSFTLDNQLPPSATPSPENPVNESLGSDPLTLELEVTELAHTLDDVVKRQMCIIRDNKLIKPTLKSILSAQNQILNRLSALERVVHCALHWGQFYQEEERYHQLPQLGNWSWGQDVHSFDVSDTLEVNRPSTSPLACSLQPIHSRNNAPTSSATPSRHHNLLSSQPTIDALECNNSHHAPPTQPASTQPMTQPVPPTQPADPTELDS